MDTSFACGPGGRGPAHVAAAPPHTGAHDAHPQVPTRHQPAYSQPPPLPGLGGSRPGRLPAARVQPARRGHRAGSREPSGIACRHRRGRELLGRSGPRVHRGPHTGQPQQRRRQPLAFVRAGRHEAPPGLFQRGADLHDVEDPGAPARGRARPHGQGVGRGHRRGGVHAQRLRGAADMPVRPRPQVRRRGPHDDAGLRPHADHLPAAGTAAKGSS